MSDPLRDPRFPDRPQHPDYWRIADVLLRLDGDASEGGKPLTEMLADVVDLKSLMYAAEHKTAQTRQIVAKRDVRTVRTMVNPDVMTALTALWMNAFAAGVLFEREGGHRDG